MLLEYIDSIDRTKEINIGDTVYFTGGGIYYSPRQGSSGWRHNPALCRVIEISGGSYPYRLVCLDGEKFNGWATAGNVVKRHSVALTSP